MNLEELGKMSKEQKEELLKNLIENDVTYWQKVLLIFSIADEKYEQLLDTLVENKTRETIMIKGRPKYDIAFKQVLEVLKYIPNNYYEKISSGFISALKKRANMNYEFKIEPNTAFEEIDFVPETHTILLMISGRFWEENGRYVKISEIFNNN